MTRPPLSLAALTILDAGPAGQIRAAAASGWTSVGLRLMPLLATDAHVVGDADAEREIVDLLAEHRMDVLEIGVFPIKAAMDWPRVSAVLAFSGRIGARFAVCPVEDADPNRRVTSFGRLSDIAAEHGLRALVEFNPYSACATLADALAIVDAARRANTGLVIDALHLSRSGGCPDDLIAIDQGLLDLVHLCDAPQPPSGARTTEALRTESRTARLLPGEGSLWLDQLLAVLPLHTALSIEAPCARDAGLSATERARRALAATHALLAKPSTRRR